MKVLVCLHDYLPRHPGGSEIHAHQVACELARRGHEVTALFTERDLSVPEGTVREGTLDGVRTIEVVHQREYADVRETYLQRRSLEHFRRIVGELSPDVVHFQHFALWGSGALPAAREAGARVVLTVHDYHALCDTSILLRSDDTLCEGEPGCTECLARHPLLPERWPAGWRDLKPAAALARAAEERHARHAADLAAVDVVITPSRFCAQTLGRAGLLRAEDCVLMKAGYPGPLRPPREAPRSPLRVGYVGGVYRSKGLHVLVGAFSRLGDLEVELSVHGHLDWFPAYVDELRRAADGSRVRFAGPFDPAQVDAVLAEIDVLCVPSIWYENMPLTIQEAFRNGIPVVVTALGGMAEAVVDGRGGLTFPRGDEGALAAVLRRLVEEPGLYARLAASRPPVPRLEEVCDRLERLYRGPVP